MTLYEYLKIISEPMPEWLKKFNPDSAFNRDDFFTSRVIFIRDPEVMDTPASYLVLLIAHIALFLLIMAFQKSA